MDSTDWLSATPSFANDFPVDSRLVGYCSVIIKTHKEVHKIAPNNDKPIANPLIIFREGCDDWAVLFNPASGEGFVINPVSVFIWKLLDGEHTVQNIIAEVRKNCEDVPDDVETRVNIFIDDLIERGYAGYEVQKV